MAGCRSNVAAGRLCPACGADDPVGANEALWPPGWGCPACGARVPVRDGIPTFAPELAEAARGFDPALFDRLARIEATHFWFVARSMLIVGLADRYFPNARRCLEIGCGNGAVLRALAASRRWERLAGADMHPAGLRHARARLPRDIELVQLDARAIPAAAAFDLVGAFDVIEHVADDEAVLRAMRRAVVPGGGVMIAAPQHPWLWSRADEVAHHQRRYRRGEIEARLRCTGFEVVFTSSFAALPLPLMALSRLSARRATGDAAFAREMSPGPVANAVLGAILRAEVRLTLAGLRWPIGGSRVVVARAI